MIRRGVFVALLTSALAGCSGQSSPDGTVTLKCEGGRDYFYAIFDSPYFGAGSGIGMGSGKWSAPVEAGRPMAISPDLYLPFDSVEISRTSYIAKAVGGADDGRLQINIERSDGRFDLTLTENKCVEPLWNFISLPDENAKRAILGLPLLKRKPPECKDEITYRSKGTCSPATAPAATQKF